jgi:hypothetical protein
MRNTPNPFHDIDSLAKWPMEEGECIPDEHVRDKAKQWVRDLETICNLAQLPFITPFVSTDGQGAVTLEWWMQNEA